MSEPGAGSDLAGAQTRATRNADGWCVRGTKVWTSNAHRSQYMIALVRSPGTADDRQRGLSQFIVDLATPGIRIQPIRGLTGDACFNEVMLDDVQLPADALVGQEGGGWAQVNAALAYERSGPERLLSSIVLVDEWLAWLRSDAAPAPEAISALGAIAAQLVVLRRLSLAVTAEFDLQLFTRRLLAWRMQYGSETFWAARRGKALLANDRLAWDFVRSVGA